MKLVIHLAILSLALLSNLVVGQLFYQNVKFSINDLNFFEIYQSNVYIIDLSKNNNKNKELVLTCSSRNEVLDLNLTFSGLDYKLIRVI